MGGLTMGYYDNYGATCKTCKFFTLAESVYEAAFGNGECMVKSGTPVYGGKLACSQYVKEKVEGEE